MWQFDPNQYEESSFSIIPLGDHRVRINDVISKKSKNTGNDMFEIVLDVSGYGSKLWYYLVLDPSDPKKTNQRIGTFFDSFGITDYNLANYPRWKGKIGAVRVVHEEYNGENQAKVRFCLNKKNQDKLPAWKESGNASATATASNFAPIVDNDDALPFE